MSWPYYAKLWESKVWDGNARIASEAGMAVSLVARIQIVW